MSLQQAAARIEETSVSRNPEHVVKQLAVCDHARWDKFVRESTGGTFYHLFGWKSVIESQLHHPTYYLYCENNGDIEAVLPLAHVKSLLFGDALISVPFLVYGGPLAASEAALGRIIDAAINLARELAVDHLELRNQKPLEGNWHTNDAYATFRKHIDPDPEINLMAVPRKQRAMIRKGIQAGLKAEVDNDTRRLHTAMLACKRNLGTPFFGSSWLTAIKDEFGDQAEILTVTSKGSTVCSVMSFRYGDEILPFYGGGGESARDLSGNDFMYWAVMKKACQEGVRIFDYGRSMIGSGAYRFKKHWGFEAQPLSYQYILVNAEAVPNLNPANPKYRLLIETWKRLPVSVAGWLGPRIASRIG